MFSAASSSRPSAVISSKPLVSRSSRPMWPVSGSTWASAITSVSVRRHGSASLAALRTPRGLCMA
eukprot:4519012-Prymnesium_polylepis.1